MSQAITVLASPDTSSRANVATRTNGSRRTLRCIAALLAVSVAWALAAPSAQGTVLTFDDLPESYYGPYVPNGYGGLGWVNLCYLDPAYSFGGQDADSGYMNGMVSPQHVTFNDLEQAVTIYAEGSPFTFNSAYFTGAWNDGLVIEIDAVATGHRGYNTTFTVDSTAPTLEVLNWADLNSMTISSSGGTDHGYGHSGTHFAMDNMTVNEVPEPSALILVVAAAFSSMAFTARRDRIHCRTRLAASS